MELANQKEQFINTWGALGTEWGINKSVAQIHALLLASSNPLSTDDIMQALKISRGNANMSVRQLQDLGIIYKKVIAGDRKEYFVAEKDILKWALKIALYRKQKELDPVMDTLKDIKNATKNDKTAEGKEFHQTVADIQNFTAQINQIAEKVLNSNRGELLIKLLKIIM